MNTPTSRMLSSIAAANLASDDIANSNAQLPVKSPVVPSGTNPMKMSRQNSQRSTDSKRVGIADRSAGISKSTSNDNDTKKHGVRAASPKVHDSASTQTPVKRANRRQSMEDALSQSRRQSAVAVANSAGNNASTAAVASSSGDDKVCISELYCILLALVDAGLVPLHCVLQDHNQPAEELRKQLIMERNNNERVMMQVRTACHVYNTVMLLNVLTFDACLCRPASDAGADE